jgi:hypothetical protein
MRLFRLLPMLVAGVTLLSTGCLDFDKETFVLVFPRDATKDEIQALLVYEGFQVSGKEDKDTKQAISALDLLCNDNQFFFAGHPFLTIPIQGKQGEKATEKEKQQAELFRKHLSVKKGPFFLNKDGALCGSQVLTIREAKKFIEGVNQIISEEAAEAAEKQLKGTIPRKFDVETLKMWQNSLKNKHQWVTYEPGRVNFTMLGSPEHFRSIKKDAIENVFLADLRLVVDPMRKERPAPEKIIEELRGMIPTLERVRDALATLPWSVDQRKDRITFSLGVGDGEPLRVPSPYSPSMKGRTEPLVEHAKEMKLGLVKDATAESVIADFLKKNR